MVRYLRDELSEPERTNFEERLLLDQGFSDEVAACEQELIDDYARGRLPRADRATIATWIESSPRRSERAAMAKAFLLHQQRSRPVAGFLSRNFVWRLTAAACLLIGFGLAIHFLVQRNFAQPREVQRSSVTAPSTPAPTVATVPKADVVLLVAETLRGASTPTLYRIHRDAPVDFQVLLPQGSDAPVYSADLSAVGRSKMPSMAWDGLPRQVLRDSSYLRITLPAHSLLPGTYSMMVSGKGTSVSTRFRIELAQP